MYFMTLTVRGADALAVPHNGMNYPIFHALLVDLKRNWYRPVCSSKAGLQTGFSVVYQIRRHEISRPLARMLIELAALANVEM